jgi:hypothetical protein
MQVKIKEEMGREMGGKTLGRSHEVKVKRTEVGFW